ncbi:hypothetical protein NEMIN01_2325 [Nematocida minor]|uniref:uncharacterized protein n=1 Tax=Nematocida minor TaxID=1912983 RepID=UPI002220DA69|nr:uncharacterized protein NEMIN01_2325 [Nematocida minor]KAI5192973.1 hypothetical protein NEMIN01_2325 [Nematocida minor]
MSSFNLKRKIKYIVGLIILLPIAGVIIWIKAEYQAFMGRISTEEPYIDLEVASEYTGDLNITEEKVSDSLNKIVELYSDTCRLSAADSNGMFNVNDLFVKVLIEHLKEDVLRFARESFTLSEIIEFMTSPEESRNPYLCGLDFNSSAAIRIPPSLAIYTDDILSILLTFIDLQGAVQKAFIIQDAEPSADFKFSKFKYFSTVEQFTLNNVTLHSNTFKNMESFKALMNLSVVKKVKLVGDRSVKVSIATLKSLTIIELEEEEVGYFLRSTDRSYEKLDLSIFDVNLTNAQAISKLSCLSSLVRIDLRGIVFKEIPDFTFIKKATNLETLNMENIFYGYDEKYEESSFAQIRKNVNYLNLSQVQKKYSTYTEQEKKIIDENKRVGEEISINTINVTKNVYCDLGVSNVKTDINIDIHVMFPLEIGDDFSNTDSYFIGFCLDLEQNYIGVLSTASSSKPDKQFLIYVDNLVLPFSSCKTIQRVLFQINHEVKISELFIDSLMKSTYLYSSSSSIEKLSISSTKSASVDINTIIECGKHFKNLKQVTFHNGRITQVSILDKNQIGVDNTPEYEVYTANGDTAAEVDFIRNS